MKKVVHIVKHLLLAFVLISIGFALGKNFSSQNNTNEEGTEYKAYTENSFFLKVYYFHSTFRCSTCNKIEKLTKDLLQKKYGNLLNTKKIIFSEIDFQANEKLAEKYGIVASCVVVAINKGDKTIEYKRLDEVWTLINNPNEFNKYISNTINTYLEKVKD